MGEKAIRSEPRIIGIDGCRALACLGVFTVNYLNKINFDSTQYFVDFGKISGRFGIVTLIVLSGFGLSVPFWRALAERQRMPSTKDFWIRRFLRIAPLYYVCLLVLVIHNDVWKKSNGWTDIFLHVSFLYNYSNQFYYSLNPVFWVLAFFLHFYLVLPILFWVGRGGTKNAVAVMTIAMLGAYLAHVYLCSLDNNGASGAENLVLTKSFLAYLPHFLVGALAGWAYVAWDEKPQFAQSRFFRWGAFWLLLALLVAGLGTPIADNMELPYAVYHFPFTPVLISLLLLAAATGSASGMLESMPVRHFALLSYGIFIFHYPVINLSLRLVPKLGLNPQEHVFLTAVFALLVTTGIAAVTYVCVEKPVRAMSGKLFE